MSGTPPTSLQLVGVPGLGEVTEDVAVIDRLDDGADVSVAGEEQPDRVGVFAANVGEKLDAGRLRHPLVRHDDVDLEAALPELAHQVGSLVGGDRAGDRGGGGHHDGDQGGSCGAGAAGWVGHGGRVSSGGVGTPTDQIR